MSTNTPSSMSIIGILGMLAIIFMAIQLLVERYGLVDRNNIMLARLLTFAFMINIGILIFMIISYNHVGGRPGPVGPKGIRGAPGDMGTNATMDSCAPMYRTLGTLRTRQVKRQNIDYES